MYLLMFPLVSDLRIYFLILSPILAFVTIDVAAILFWISKSLSVTESRCVNCVEGIFNFRWKEVRRCEFPLFSV